MAEQQKPQDHGYFIMPPMKDGDLWGVYGPNGIICCEKSMSAAVKRVIDCAVRCHE